MKLLYVLISIVLIVAIFSFSAFSKIELKTLTNIIEVEKSIFEVKAKLISEGIDFKELGEEELSDDGATKTVTFHMYKVRPNFLGFSKSYIFTVEYDVASNLVVKVEYMLIASGL